MAWSRKVDWCAVVAIPLVTLTAFLNPIDAFASAVHYSMARRGVGGPRIWLAGDVAPGWRTSVRPPDRRPRRGRRTTTKPRGRVRP